MDFLGVPDIWAAMKDGYDRAEARDQGKAKNLLSALEYFGGSPSDAQASQLKQVLGFDWPSTTTTPTINMEGPTSGGSFNMQGNPKREYAKATGSNPLALLTALAKIKEGKNTVTPNSVIGNIMAKKSEGQPLTENDEALYSDYRSARSPWFTGNLDDEGLDKASMIAAGLSPNAYQDATLGMDKDKLQYKKEYDDKHMAFKERALSDLNTRFQKGLISVDAFRKGMLKLNTTSKAIQSILMSSLLNGEELPDMNLESLYGIQLPGGPAKPTPGKGSVTTPQGEKIVDRIIAEKPEARKALINTLLEGYSDADRSMIHGLYQKRLGIE